GRIYAASDAVVRDPLERPDAQHSSGAAAAIQRPRYASPGTRGRREVARRHRPLCRAGNGCGTDRRAGFGRGARGRHGSDAGRARAGGRAPHLSASTARAGRRPGESGLLVEGKRPPRGQRIIFQNARSRLSGSGAKSKTPGARAGGYKYRDCPGTRYQTLRFSAEVRPRLVTSSYSTSWPSFSVRNPAPSTAEMCTNTSLSPLAGLMNP